MLDTFLGFKAGETYNTTQIYLQCRESPNAIKLELHY